MLRFRVLLTSKYHSTRSVCKRPDTSQRGWRPPCRLTEDSPGLLRKLGSSICAFGSVEAAPPGTLTTARLMGHSHPTPARNTTPNTRYTTSPITNQQTQAFERRFWLVVGVRVLVLGVRSLVGLADRGLIVVWLLV